MSVIINASTSSGLIQSADTSGEINIQSNGTTKFTVDSTGAYGQLIRGTLATTTSGTSVDFTSLPSWVKRITVMLDGISTSGSSPLIIQLGDAGGIETTGYISSSGNIATATASVTSATNGFIVSDIASASNTTSGIATIVNITSNTWICSGTSKQSTAGITYFAGDKSLSDVFTRIRLTTANGTDTFDAGSINIIYEG